MCVCASVKLQTYRLCVCGLACVWTRLSLVDCGVMRAHWLVQSTLPCVWRAKARDSVSFWLVNPESPSECYCGWQFGSPLRALNFSVITGNKSTLATFKLDSIHWIPVLPSMWSSCSIEDSWWHFLFCPDLNQSLPYPIFLTSLKNSKVASVLLFEVSTDLSSLMTKATVTLNSSQHFFLKKSQPKRALLKRY